MLFKKAQEEQQQNCLDVAAKRFLIAANILEVLKCFGEMDPEADKVMKFCKVSAIEILKRDTSSTQREHPADKNVASKEDSSSFYTSSSSPDSSNHLPANSNVSLPSNPEPKEQRSTTALSSFAADVAAQLPIVSASTSKVPPENVADAIRHAKFAISALQFDDVQCAVENLQKALVFLQAA